MKTLSSNQAPKPPPFALRDFFNVFAMGIILYVCFAGLLSFAPGAGDFLDAIHPTLSFILQYLLQLVILFFPLWVFVINKYDLSWKDFGLRKVSILKLIGLVLASYIGYFIISTFLVTLFEFNNIQVPGYEAQESYIPFFGTDTLGMTAAFIFIVFIAPFLEEFFFRGFVYRVFTKTWPIWLGSIVTAALFALIHFQFQSAIPLFILGLILNYNYQKTGSIWTSIAFHSFNNFIAFSLEIYLYLHPEIFQEMQELATATIKLLG